VVSDRIAVNQQPRRKDLLSLMMSFDGSSLPVKEPQDNSKSNKAYQAILAEVANQGGEIRDDATKEWYRGTEENLDCDAKRHEQQGNFDNLANPFLYHCQSIHP
jgi:hypothetical protein